MTSNLLVMRSLKVLSSKMDPAEIRFILEVFVKEKNLHVPKIPRHLVQLGQKMTKDDEV
jgi:hypothetical protein